MSRWLLGGLLLVACDGPQQTGVLAGPGAQPAVPVVVSGGTPVALMAVATPTVAVSLRVSTPVPSAAQPTATAPSTGQVQTPKLASSAVDRPLTTRALAETPPVEQSAREQWTVDRAEAEAEQGRPRQALAALDAGPVPVEASDLVALRKAELALALGDRSRARAELAGPALEKTTNRIVLVRAAEAAERAEAWSLAAGFWDRAAKQPTWYSEKLRAQRGAAEAYAKAGDPLAAAERISAVADGQGKNPDPALVAQLKANDALTNYHVALLAQAEGNPGEAIQKLRRYLEIAPGGPYAEASRRRLTALTASGGSSAWDAAKRADTSGAYDAFRRANPTSTMVPEAHFRQGLAHYRDDEPQRAIELWGEAAKSATGENRSRAFYWIGKALSEQGMAEAAAEHWRWASEVRPSNFYSVRAGDRLAERSGWPSGGTTLPGAATTSDEEAEAQRWLDGWTGAAQPSASDLAVLSRAALFSKLGFERTAGAELDALIESTDNPRTIYAAGRRAQDGALWSSSVRAGLRLARLGPEKTALDSPRAVRRMAYPSGYAELVGAESAMRDVGPVLLLSLIRQESLFDRFARSPVDARGLTQVMPSTGSEIAKRTGQSGFNADDLFNPNVSVNFGARYLAGQIVYFEGDVFRAVAAYNAGGGAAARWASGSDDPDLFVESIAYAETREYVKSIYTHHAAYRSLVTVSR